MLRLFLFILILCFPSSEAMAQSQSEKVQAVFLFKFFYYTTWPDHKDPQKTKNAVVCMYGEHPFGDSLRYIAEKKSDEVRYRVLDINDPREAKKCHIVYVSRSKSGRIGEFSNSSILLTSNWSGFLDQGGIIQMQESAGKIKLSIHLGNAKKQNLKISSRLLKIAEVIR